jgi:glycosyltransferase involved in cell wall biosynthesis
MRASEIVVPDPAIVRSGGLFVGALTEENGAGVLREALDLFPGARIEVIDAGPSETRERMRRAAYLVLPALACDDGLPRPIIEAFASGLPVIGSRVGAIAEMVEPGRNGLLFEAGSAQELARRLAWAEAFPERMRQMGECAKADYEARFIADFSIPTLFGERRRAARL